MNELANNEQSDENCSIWYSINFDAENKFVCAACKNTIDLVFGSLDHHPRICPLCNVECLFFSYQADANIQIIPENAHYAVQKFIKWSQENLDELEFVELMCSMEEITAKLHKGRIE